MRNIAMRNCEFMRMMRKYQLYSDAKLRKHANDANGYEIFMNDIVYKELSYKITGICYKVHKSMGRFCREKQYADKLESLLKKEGVNCKREIEIEGLDKDSPRGNRADFLIEQKMILDVKAKKFVTKEDYYQMQRYLRFANLGLGLIVNFRNTYLKPKRVLNSLAKVLEADTDKHQNSQHSHIY